MTFLNLTPERESYLQKIYLQHARNTPVLDRIEYVITDNSYKGRPTYIGPIGIIQVKYESPEF